MPEPLDAFRRRASDAGLDLRPTLRHGPLMLNLDRYELTVGGVTVPLPALQVELLAVFLAAPDRVWSRRQLDSLIRGRGGSSRRIDVRLARLRARLGVDLFRSIKGRGWILRPSEQLPTDKEQ